MGKIMKTSEAYNQGLLKIGIILFQEDHRGRRTELKIIGKNYEDNEGDITFPCLLGPDFTETVPLYPFWNGGGIVEFHKKSIIGGNMFETVKSEAKEFFGDNKQVFYWGVILFLVDYYVFGNSFKKKLEKLFGNLIDKVTNVVGKTDNDKPAAAE